jgi:hypothetical protein
MRCLGLTLLVALAFPLTACVTLVPDLSVSSVAARTAPAVGQLPERPVISVSLRTKTDLTRVPKDELLHAEVFFCDSPKDFVLLGRGLYVDPPLTPLLDSLVSKPPDSSGTYTYVVLLEVTRRGSPNSRPPEVGFDLLTAPRTVCIKLQGGYIGMFASSNMVQVPAGRISEALALYNRKPGG